MVADAESRTSNTNKHGVNQVKVQELMTQDVNTCGPQDSVNRAAQLIWEHDCGCVPVVDEKLKILGVVTDRDICVAAYTQGLPLSSIPIGSAMAKEVFACKPGDPIGEAEKILKEKQVRRLPVVNADGELVGIVSLSDIVRQAELQHGGKSVVNHDQTTCILASICQPRSAAVAEHAAQ
jgi:CBS-domain-containing membrane protein